MAAAEPALVAAADGAGSRGARVPPGAIGVTLLLWGWQQETLPYAVLMALVAEVARAVRWRWELADADFNRLADVSAVCFLLTAAYQFDQRAFYGIYGVLKWLPCVAFLLLAGQLYSTRDAIKYSAMFWSVRRAVRRGRLDDTAAIDFSGPFVAICLTAATGGGAHREWLYPALALVVGWVVWHNRPRRYRSGTGLAVLVLALGLGYLGAVGVVALRRMIEPMMLDYFREHIYGWRDPYRAFTAIGYIGRLKLSDRIVLRVSAPRGQPVPTLLREASYETFSKNIWLAGDTRFDDVRPDVEGTSWKLHDAPRSGEREVRISRSTIRGKAMLPFPGGTVSLTDLPVEILAANPLGALKALKAPGLVEYTAHYLPGRSFEEPPTRADTLVPRDLRPLFEHVVTELHLAGRPPREVLARLARWFATRFTYSVTLHRPEAGATPLADFLDHTHSGHCELFATSTVLALRAAGVPARYEVGYSVQEYSPLEHAYVVRRRHAHSWALAWVDGAWRDFDTTPPAWGPIEGEAAPWWQPIYDGGSWLWFRYERWRWDTQSGSSDSLLLWLAAALVVYLGWRLYFSERVRLGGARRGESRPAGPRPGADSDFYAVEQALAARGLRRRPGETPIGWLHRLAEVEGVAGAAELLDRIVPAHYRYRFDPRGIDAAAREDLRRGVHEWLARHGAREARRAGRT